jgi:hypothetical protein
MSGILSLHETIKTKVFKKVKERYPLVEYDEVSVDYDDEELEAVSPENPELDVRVSITCDEEAVEYDVVVDLFQ